jgi:hypothetical protein
MAIKLPERNYFTFPEIMGRWQCTENDIRHIVISEKLRPSYFIRRDFEYSEIEERDPGTFEEVPVSEEMKFLKEGLYYLQTGDQLGPFDCEFGSFTTSRERPNLADGELNCDLYFLEKALPLSHVLEHGVVTLEELAFVERALSASSERGNPPKDIATRERNTLLTIIAALCNEAGIDFSKPAKAAGVIQSTAAKMGVSIGETTIEGHLKKIPDALEARMK